MKNLTILTLVLATLNAAGCFAQGDEHIYFATGSKIKGKIESADDEKINTVLDNGARYPGLRDKFVIFFNKSGDYLTEKSIARDAQQAQQQIQDFYGHSPEAKVVNDILFKASPREVIACHIKNEFPDAINYVTLDGKSASINKDNLFAIIRQSGSHEMLRDLPEVADNLSVMRDDFEKLRFKKTQEQPAGPVQRPTVTPSVPEVRQTVLPGEKKRLSSDEQKVYKAKSVDKMHELAELLTKIVDNTQSRKEKDHAIEQAAKMFIKDATVEVSAVNNPNNKTRRNVTEYLGRLSRLNYSKVNVTYAEINFVEEFEPDTAGNFWGLASYTQTFSTNNFEDVTPKKQKIKLQPYEKIVDGLAQDKFEVLLGNISIHVSP